MKLIRLYSFRHPTAKFPPLEYKSTLFPSPQVFANGLPPSPSSLSPFQDSNDYKFFQEQKSKFRLRFTTPSGAEG